MKKAIAALLSLCLFVALLAVPAFAAEKQAEPEQDPGVLADVLGVLDSAYVGSNIKLYVPADKSAGLQT
ncbi:MAG: hypothetical protein E7567_08545, partial [Ruminococcaceae bacterium]|nr:hypothetical protein [Oscillospiraceae bacterium]